MDTRDIMIEARELSRTFGKKQVVDGVSLSARRGEIFGLLGPNGAGKTTTIRMLTGQIEPSGGSARVAGYDVVHQRRELKQVIGVVFEEQNLYERLSARLNLEVSCWLYDLPKTRVNEVLDLVRLRDRAKDPVRTFSNGMKQRVMIARALLHRPRVLFLDEPSRGLDPITAREVRQAVRDLCQEGMTILMTTHLMEEADQLCHRVAFINNGHIVANDTPRNLKLAHGEPTLTVTLSQTGQDEQSLQEQELSLNNSTDQAQLEAWMREGLVRAIHSNEASLEDVLSRSLAYAQPKTQEKR